jgi:hypothetical protein
VIDVPEAGDEDRLFDPLARDLGMEFAPLCQLEAGLQRVQQVVAGDQASDGMQLRLVAQGGDEDAVGLPEIGAAEIVEPRSSASLGRQRIGVELDPGRVAVLVEGLHPGGARTGLPDRHGEGLVLGS